MKRALMVIPSTLALVVLPASTLAVAAPGDSQIVHRQSVKVELSPTGEQEAARLFTQVTYLGDGGTVTLPDQPTDGLRNLQGFSAPQVDGDSVTWQFAGPGLARSVADVDIALPVGIDIAYSLDGEPIAPDDLVGRSGLFEATYTVTNLTTEDREVEYVDAFGKTQTATVPVAVPMVGSLSTTLDSRFEDVEAPGAVVVGDGRGSTVVNVSLLMFAPLATDVATATYRARVHDAVLPPVSLQVIPVDSGSFGSIGSTEAAYSGAVDDLTQLTDGSSQIDQNLQTLADGAAELLAGLRQLSDGATELASGLADADDGAGKLADGTGEARSGGQRLAAGLDLLDAGAGELSSGLASADTGGRDLATGLSQLSSGAGDLAAGADELAAGTVELNAGAKDLSTGAGQLSGGASSLLGGLLQLKTSLNDADAGLPAALDGIGALLAGLGSRTTAGQTVLYGLQQIQLGISNGACVPTNPTDPTNPCGILETLGLLKLGITNPACNPAVPATCGAKDGVDGVLAELPAAAAGADQIAGAASSMAAGLGTAFSNIQAALDAGYALDPNIEPLLSGLQAMIGNPSNPASWTPDTLLYGLTAIETGAGGLKTGANDAVAALTSVSAGLAQVAGGLAALEDAIGDPATAGTLRNGVAQVLGGLDNPACDPANPQDPANPCGVKQGLQSLQAGLSGALGDVNDGLGATDVPGETLLYGAGQVAGGAAELATGAEQLRTTGTAPLEAGAVELRDGAEQVAGGASQADAGAKELAAGLDQLAAGSETLADGVGDADVGASDLASGLVELDQGANQLASGLSAAAPGSQELADGLTQAVDGGSQVADGSDQLQSEGTGELVTSVGDAAADSALQVAQIRAVDERGRTEKLPFGTVDGAEASAVYQFDIAGVAASHEGLGTGWQLVLGLVLLAGAGLVGAVVRRRLV